MDTEKATKKVEAAQKREDAAKLRRLAAGQQANANAHRQQAERPAYPEQAGICVEKASRIEAFAGENIAKAERLEAEANLLDAD